MQKSLEKSHIFSNRRGIVLKKAASSGAIKESAGKAKGSSGKSEDRLEESIPFRMVILPGESPGTIHVFRNSHLLLDILKSLLEELEDLPESQVSFGKIIETFVAFNGCYQIIR